MYFVCSMNNQCYILAAAETDPRFGFEMALLALVLNQSGTNPIVVIDHHCCEAVEGTHKPISFQTQTLVLVLDPMATLKSNLLTVMMTMCVRLLNSEQVIKILEIFPKAHSRNSFDFPQKHVMFFQQIPAVRLY